MDNKSSKRFSGQEQMNENKPNIKDKGFASFVTEREMSKSCKDG